MSRALRHAGGILLAVAAVVTAHAAWAKNPAVRVADANTRLEEIKVELALLSDTATFPYSFDARGSVESLELRGCVPNEQVRQRALELARRSTFLTVTDGLKIQTAPSTRPARELQKAGAELLYKTLSEPAKTISLAVRTNGVIVITGSIDSLESKLEVSRILRSLPGCRGVVNELTVLAVARDGQRLVQVTRDGSLVVPPSALGLQLNPFTASSPAAPLATPVAPTLAAAASAPAKPLPTAIAPMPVPMTGKPAPPRIGTVLYTLGEPKLPVKWTCPAPKWDVQAKKLEPINVPPASPLPQPVLQLTDNQPSAPAVKPPTIPPPLPTALTPSSLEAHKDELRLPTAVVPKPAPPRIGTVLYTLGEPKLPVKWTCPAPKWDVQAKKLEPINGPPTPPLPQPVLHQAKAPTPLPSASPPSSAKTRVAPPTDMTWQRPDNSEESEPKVATVPHKNEIFASAPADFRPMETPPAPPMSSQRRWPPAYESAPPPSKGRPAVITFDDEPPPSRAVPGTAAPAPALVPAKLQHQVKSVCGRQAREVMVQTQRDGIIVVKVKVANLSVEDQLSRKILAIPGMTSPQVRLLMDVGP